MNLPTKEEITEYTTDELEEIVQRYFTLLDTITRARDKLILKRRTEGQTLQAIGDSFGLTHERVRQICEKHGVERGVRKDNGAEGEGE